MAETLEERKERIRHELQEQCPWGDPEEGEIWWREQAVEREAAMELARFELKDTIRAIAGGRGIQLVREDLADLLEDLGTPALAALDRSCE